MTFKCVKRRCVINVSIVDWLLNVWINVNLRLTHAWLVTLHICHLYMSHDSSAVDDCFDTCHMTDQCVIWLIEICDMMHSYIWYDSFIVRQTSVNRTWVTPHMCHFHMLHDSSAVDDCFYICHPYDEACHTYQWVMSLIWMSHVTHIMSHVTRSNESRHT